ncbi:hypothetical protein B0H13DRAFT_1885634 [Mycena leptocephala]|nr:hypothetical protein B0H13DRAFT_1885634 [Mycena leptocephala]
MDRTPQRGRRVTARQIISRTYSEEERMRIGQWWYREALTLAEWRFGEGVQPNHPCTKEADERWAGETDDRIVECMDGGGLVETDEFLVARGRFLGIGTDSNGAPSAIDMEMHFRNAGFSNELVAEVEANIGRVVGGVLHMSIPKIIDGKDSARKYQCLLLNSYLCWAAQPSGQLTRGGAIQWSVLERVKVGS